MTGFLDRPVWVEVDTKSGPKIMTFPTWHHYIKWKTNAINDYGVKLEELKYLSSGFID
jgi:hypothetical protein